MDWFKTPYPDPEEVSLDLHKMIVWREPMTLSIEPLGEEWTIRAYDPRINCEVNPGRIIAVCAKKAFAEHLVWYAQKAWFYCLWYERQTRAADGR